MARYRVELEQHSYGWVEVEAENAERAEEEALYSLSVHWEEPSKMVMEITEKEEF